MVHVYVFPLLAFAQAHGEHGQGDEPSHGDDGLLETHNIQCEPCNLHSNKSTKPDLLHWCNLQNLIQEGDPQEKVNNLRFLDGHRGQGIELNVLVCVGKLDWNPFLVCGLHQHSLPGQKETH